MSVTEPDEDTNLMKRPFGSCYIEDVHLHMQVTEQSLQTLTATWLSLDSTAITNSTPPRGRVIVSLHVCDRHIIAR